MIRVENLTMELQVGGNVVHILNDLTFNVPKNQVVAVVGPSGSGKSTLLGLLAGLDKPTSGSIYLNENEITLWNEYELAHFRRKNVGYVFQAFHLIPTLTALENISLPLELSGESLPLERAQKLLDSVGLQDRQWHYPAQLSGGEQQRIAVARAFACQPAFLLADEPTGNLDSVTSQIVIDLLLKLHSEQDSTLVLVTHDPKLAECAQRILTLYDGKLINDEITRW